MIRAKTSRCFIPRQSVALSLLQRSSKVVLKRSFQSSHPSPELLERIQKGANANIKLMQPPVFHTFDDPCTTHRENIALDQAPNRLRRLCARRSPVYYTAAAVNDNDSARSASRVRTMSGQKKMTQMVAGREDNVFHYVDLWMNLPL